eukprot:UN28741
MDAKYNDNLKGYENNDERITYENSQKKPEFIIQNIIQNATTKYKRIFNEYDNYDPEKDVFLTMTLAKGVDPLLVFGYAASFRAHHNPEKYKLVIFCPKNEEYLKEYQEMAKQLSFDLEHFDENNFQTRWRSEIMDHNTIRYWHLLTWRHFLYRDYLYTHWRKYKGILISDCNDVAFNGNMFELIPKRSIEEMGDQHY